MPTRAEAAPSSPAHSPSAWISPPPLSAGAYVRLPTDSQAPGLWDGRNATGSLVVPGLYLYQVEVKVDTGAERAAGVIGVAY